MYRQREDAKSVAYKENEDGFPEAMQMWNWHAVSPMLWIPVPWGDPGLVVKDEGVMGHCHIQGTLVAC